METTIDASSNSVRVTVIRAPEPVTARVQEELAECWAQTAGGAVGFPWPPVTVDDARDAVGGLMAQLDAGRTVLVIARDRDGLAGWVSLEHNQAALVAHWGSVRRLQTYPRARGRGIGSLLMKEVARVAREDDLEQLHLAVRGGMGLEDFYRKLGWQVVGSWPRALRFSDDDYRDEVLMWLDLTAPSPS